MFILKTILKINRCLISWNLLSVPLNIWLLDTNFKLGKHVNFPRLDFAKKNLAMQKSSSHCGVHWVVTSSVDTKQLATLLPSKHRNEKCPITVTEPRVTTMHCCLSQPPSNFCWSYWSTLTPWSTLSEWNSFASFPYSCCLSHCLARLTNCPPLSLATSPLAIPPE